MKIYLLVLPQDICSQNVKNLFIEGNVIPTIARSPAISSVTMIMIVLHIKKLIVQIKTL